MFCRRIAGGGESFEDFLVCRYLVGVVFGGEWSYQDGVGGCVQCHHEVLVTTAGTRLKSPSIVGEEVIEWDFVQFHSAALQGCWGVKLQRLRRPNVLSRLGHVSLCCFRCVRAIPCDEAHGEAGPCGVHALFNGGEPCGFDGESGCGMQVGNKGWYAG